MARQGRRRHVPSSIDRLDPEIRRLITDLRIERGWTIDQIRERLMELGQPVSRSALGRHVRALPDIAREMRESREMAEALAREVGNAPEDKLAELNIELMHGVMLKLLTSARAAGDGDGATEDGSLTFSPAEVMQMARATKDLAQSRKLDVERVEKLEKRAEERGRMQAMEKVEEVARNRGGLSADTVMAIRQAVLGDA